MVREGRVADVLLGAGAPDAPALIDRDSTLTYAELAQRVDARAGELALTQRSLVAVEATNDVDFVATYLALVRDGHVPLLAGPHTETARGGVARRRHDPRRRHHTHAGGRPPAASRPRAAAQHVRLDRARRSSSASRTPT